MYSSAKKQFVWLLHRQSRLIFLLSLFVLHYQEFQSADRMIEICNDQNPTLALRYYIEQCKHAWLVCENQAGHVWSEGSSMPCNHLGVAIAILN
jgi:hypothetical protein